MRRSGERINLPKLGADIGFFPGVLSVNELPAIVVGSGLAIGVAYGAVGLLSGFCLLSGLRGWWADGDGRLIRTYRAGARRWRSRRRRLLAAGRLVDLGKSIYLQPSFSAPLMFVRRPPVRLRHGAVERLRLARAGAARARQSAFASWW